jgi:aminoglycoside 6'-N-acetyltransferase
VPDERPTRHNGRIRPLIRFRALEEADLPLLDRWLSTPHVRAWWGRPGPTLDAIHAQYGPLLRGDTDAVAYLVLSSDVPIGYIQRYPVRDEAWGLRPSTPAVGLDLFIGDPGYLYRGLGPQILRQFLGEIVFSDNTIVECWIDPIARNRAAIRAFEKAGFRHIATARGADLSEPVYLMRITRAEHDRTIK